MKRRQTFSVLIWLSASRAKNPEGILYARVTVDGRRAEISLGKKVKPLQWDERASKVLGRTPEAHQVNSFIDLVKGKLNQHYIELVANNEAVTAELIKNKYLGITEKGKTFLEVFRYHNTQMESLIGGESDELDHLNPEQTDHPFPDETDHPYPGKLTTPKDV